MLKIAKIIATRGLRGELKLYPYTNTPEDLDRISQIYIEGNSEPYKIKSLNLNKNVVFVRLEGVDSIEKAEKLKNLDVFIDEAETLEFLGDDSFFYEDLIGIEVHDEDDKYLGEVVDLRKLPTQETLVIEKEGREWMLPFIDEFILGLDLEEKRLTIKLIEGLIDEE